MASIAIRRGPNGTEVFFNSQWTPVDQAWIDARRADGHQIIEQGGSATIPPLVGGPNAAPLPLPSTTPAQATSVQGGVNPAAFAADGATLSPAGAILSRPGAGAQPLPMPGQTPTDPANPGATFNPQTGTFNVDPADRYKQAREAMSTATTTPNNAAEIAARRARQEAELVGYAPAPPPVDVAAYDRSIGVQNPAASPQPQSVQDWYNRLNGVDIPQFAAGGKTDDKKDGSMMADAAMPNAIVGEGMDGQVDTGEGNPHGTELVIEPQKQPGLFRVYWVEGPVMTELEPNTGIVPVSEKNATWVREQYLPLSARPTKANGANGREMGGAEMLPLPGASSQPPEYAFGGLVPERTAMQPNLVSQAALIAAPNQQQPQLRRGF